MWDRLPLFLPALVLIGVGATLLQPTDTFEASPGWRIMANDFGSYSEPIYGVLFVFVGAVHALVKLYLHRFKPVTLLALLAVYVYMASAFTIAAGVLSAGSVFCTGWMALAIWSLTHGE